MDKNSGNQEMVELVLKTLLFEVFKDGQVEQSEKDLINNLGSTLQVSRERFAEMIEQLPVESYNLDSSSDRSPAGYVEMFVSVRAKLVEHYPADKTDRYLEKLATCLGRESEFLESLSIGF